MAVTNRSLDVSEQRKTFVAGVGLVATGSTTHCFVMPSAGTLDGVRMAAAGISGSPVAQVAVLRFIAGTGFTSIGGVATTLALQTVGTSGIQSVALAASGSTLLNLVAGDVIAVGLTGANSAVATLTVAAVVKQTQDIKTQFGL
jgi:hypothetical protein